MEKWTNLGDINFLAYGGCLVKQHFTKEELVKQENKNQLSLIFDVFYLNPEYGESNDLKNYAALCCVDLTESWINYDDILQFIGEDDKIGLSLEELLKLISPKLLAKEVLDYYGVSNFNPIAIKDGKLIQYPSDWQDFIISDKDLNIWLKELGFNTNNL